MNKRLEKATQPTLYFIGVTTGASSIMKVFPKWAKALGLSDAVIKGIDLPLHAPEKDYREVVDFLKNDPLSLGALVTTHKIDLFKACQDMFDFIDPYAETLGEVSSLSKNNGLFCAHAKDPISSGLALEAFVPPNFWKNHSGEVLLLGAGGSTLAMCLYFAQDKHGDNVPRKITISNRSTPRLESAENHLAKIASRINLDYKHCPNPIQNDELIAALPPYSLVVNATGLGKDAPGSPTTDTVSYPMNSLAWEINYRGDLLFMQQALDQKELKNLVVEDGWIYFIHGWTQVISEVFHIPIEGELLAKLNEIARV
ncbi:MAG: shikimate dehydrogenase [Defluviitaleaceae bacterium]|nr:shikimate dehydrogenase [Defluviitaleaceae bacterium]